MILQRLENQKLLQKLKMFKVEEVELEKIEEEKRKELGTVKSIYKI